MNASVVILGAGNVAFHLARTFAENDMPLNQIYNRSRKGLIRIATMTKTPVITNLSKIDTAADIYIIAVKDDAIEETAGKLSEFVLPESIVVHTSGNCSIDVFRPFFKNYGAFYPLQSLQKERMINMLEVPFLISASNQKTEDILKILAKGISNKVIAISDEDRSKIHIPAVLVNNFVNHIYTLASDYCIQEKLPFEYLIPLMEETLERVKETNRPGTFQTGPAVRKDAKTIARHRSLLKVYPDVLKFYNYLTRHIQDYTYEDRK